MNQSMLAKTGRALVAGLCIATLANPRNAPGCAGSFLPACALSPTSCLKTMSLAKSAPTGMGLVGFPGGTVTLVFTLTATCPGCPGTPCAAPATPTAASASVAFYPGGAGACPPLPPAGAPTFSFATPVALPSCTAAGAFTTYTLVVPVPTTVPLGAYCAYGTVTVMFSDGMTLSASGDTVVCVVAPAPGMPGVPRLSLTLLSESAPRRAPGDMALARYLVKNNDPSNSVTLGAIAGARQSALRPQGANERQGVYAISNPFGDDFPIAFNPGTNCIPLPSHPYTQQAISNTVPVLPPGGTNIITVGIRSYGQCANGSCSESTLRVTGKFADGSPALACAGMALIVDNSVPSPQCALDVNDCNHNGIPDALDIAAGRSQDRNFNALPDECEQIINVPTSTSVTPTNPVPGQPIVVSVAFNEVNPMTVVWGNGIPLTRMVVGGIPFWQGTIPADPRPGPQTVYFLGRNQLGGLSTTIATYNVQQTNPPVPIITSVFPTTGKMGDIVTITGRGFGNNPDNLCVVAGGGPSVPLRALSATDTRVTARLGTVPPNAQPGPIMVAPGQGSTAPFTPAFSNIVVWDNWSWQSGQTGAVSSTAFTPVYVPPDDGQRWFYSTLTNGVLCVYLSGNWGANARVNVELHLRAGGSWYDMQPRTLLAGSGTTLQCATLIKDIIVCDLQQNQGVLLPATVTDLGNGTVKITVSAPNNQPITAGSLTICTTPPRVPVITGVFPDRAASGDIIRISGTGFGNNPDNICAVIGSPGGPTSGALIWDMMRVLTAADDQITARVGIVPPPMANMPPPKIMVQIGDGNAGPIAPAFPQILGGDDTWVWTSREAAAVFPSNFTTFYVPPPTNRQYFYATLTNGVLCVYLTGDWPSNSQVTVETHFTAGSVHYDMQERTVTFAGGGTTLDCALLVKDLLVCALGQRSGVLLPADVTQVSPGVVKITVRSPNSQPITSGALAICRNAPPPPPNRHWLPLLGNSTPGTPGTMSVLGSTPSNTSLRITIPGVWLTTEIYGDRPFTRVELPPVRLGGAGFPTTPGQRGWYDFPPETGYPPVPPDPYLNGLDIGVPMPDFPESALGNHPTNDREMLALGIDPAGARPGIPSVRGFVAVSRASDSNDVDVQITTQQFAIMTLPDPPIPAGFEASDVSSSNDGFVAPQLVDQTFYSTFQGTYQGNEPPVSPITRAGVFAAAEIRLPLMRVLNPSLIQICTNYVVLVKHLKGTEDFTCPIPWDSWIFKIPFINGQAIRDSLTAKGIKIEASRSAHYLILTPRIYRADLNEFAVWKQSKGLNVDFAYVGNGPTDDVTADRNAIDAYLENYFQQNYCHGVYVLIIGDVDVVPSGRTTRVTQPPDASDADSDHVYEVLGSDRFPSLYVGRLSINTSDELKNQLRKILSYERSPVPGDWPTRATLAANSQTDDGCYGVCAAFPSKYAAAVNAITSYGGYTAPPTFQKLHAGAASAAVTRAVNQDVIDAINAGRGQVLYRGHGSGTAWGPGWDGSGGSSSSGTGFSQGTHIPLLNNTAYPIVFSIACQNARLRNTESIAETWMSSSNGAVAHFGASVNSATSENHERAKGIYRAIYESGFTRLAPALAEAERISYNVTGGGGSWDNNTFAYNLLGDPELTIRRKTVVGFRLVASNLLFGAGSKLTVRGLSNAPVALTLVNVHLSSGGTVNGFTGTDGSLVLSNVPPSLITGLDLHADGYPSETTPMGPVLRAISYGTQGFVLRVQGSPGNYQILRSTDLLTWPGAGNVTIPANGTFADFTDTTAGQRRSAFYRAVTSP